MDGGRTLQVKASGSSLWRGALVASLFAALIVPTHAAAATLPSGFSERVVVGGLSSPVAAASAPDGRVFIAEKTGVVKVATPGREARALLDISSRVNSYHDRGLLGLAVDRDFSQNGYLYLLYTYDVAPLQPDSAAPMVARLSRVTVSANNTASEETVLLGSYESGPCPQASNALDCIPSDGASHSIGTIRVDPNDGTLWVGVGDSADFNRVDELAYRSYDEQSLAGKLLHVDRNGRGLSRHPFCSANSDLTDVCTKLHAKGLRNPYRFTVRPDGPPIVGDVGWSVTEELDIVPPGHNMGWPCWEGNSHTPGYEEDQRCQDLYAAGTDTKPLYTYPHASGGEAIVGGPQYTGTDWPAEYRNDIYFGDYATGLLRRVRVDDSDRCLDTDSSGACVARSFASGWYGGVDLQVGPDGGLLYVEFGDGGPNGAVKVIEYTDGNLAPTAKAAAQPLSGELPLRVQFSSEDSSDPEGAALTYDWDFGDGSAHSSEANPLHEYVAQGDYTARLTVSDGSKTGSTTLKISAGNTPPTASLTSPTSDLTYKAGDVIKLNGSAVDAQDGALTGSSLEWKVILRHGTHTHPLTTRTGETASFTAGDDHDADSNYEITLIATDSRGLSSQKTVIIKPKTVQYTLESDPTGMRVSYGGISGTTPMTRTSAVGYRTTISATQTVEVNGRTLTFDRWSDGGARSHDVVIPDSDATAKAFYVEVEEKALNKPASASSVEKAGVEADKANDGDSSTRWSSAFADNQWWQVDLGTTRDVSAVELNWETAYAKTYKIQTSTDGTTFTDAASVTLNSAKIEHTTFPTVSARYVRVLGLTRATSWGFSFWDAKVFGPTDATTTDPPPPTASYTFSPTSPQVGQAVSFDGSGSGCAATPCSYRWEDGTQAIGTGATLTHSFSTAGEHPVKLTITDAQSRSDSTTKTITVTEPPAEKALGMPATASSVEKAGVEADKANDGDSSTRWSSAFADNQWWQVDLGTTRDVSAVELNWEAAYAKTYKIQISTDGTTFTDAASVTLDSAKLERTTFPTVSARYVRVLGLTRATPWGFSFWDARVFGPTDTTTPDPPPPTASYTFSPTSPEVGQAVSFDGSGSGCAATPCSYRWEDGTQAIGAGATLTHSFSTAGEHPVKLTVTDAQSRSDSRTKTITVSEPPAEEPEDKALNKPASASSIFSKGYIPEKGNDGDSSTRWMSARTDSAWWQVDLGAARKIDTVELNWSEDYGKTYKIQVSTDGTTFTDVASVTLGAPGLQRSTFPMVDARYVRVLGLTRATRKGFSFWDARVFGPADA